MFDQLINESINVAFSILEFDTFVLFNVTFVSLTPWSTLFMTTVFMIIEFIFVEFIITEFIIVEFTSKEFVILELVVLEFVRPES